MPKNSLRLFTVSLHDGQMREPQPWEAAQLRPIVGKAADGTKTTTKPPAVDYLEQLIYDLDTRGTTPHVFGQAKAEDDEEDVVATKGHVVRWSSTGRTGTVLRLKFEAGPITEEGVLVDPDGKSADLDLGSQRRATLYPYRASLITETGKKYGILAIECRGARCPRDPLVRAMHEASPAGWRVRIHEGVAQVTAITQFIDEANVNAVTFIEYGFAKDGTKKAGQRKALRVDAVKGGFDQIKKAAKQWAMNQWKSTDAVAAQQLLPLAVSEKIAIAFNDVAVEFGTDKDQRTFKPGSNFKLFSYFLGTEIVSDDDFFDRAEAEAKKIIESVQSMASKAATE